MLGAWRYGAPEWLRMSRKLTRVVSIVKKHIARTTPCKTDVDTDNVSPETNSIGG